MLNGKTKVLDKIRFQILLFTEEVDFCLVLYLNRNWCPHINEMDQNGACNKLPWNEMKLPEQAVSECKKNCRTSGKFDVS